ncbi:alpha integrin [Paenarthrobacter nicotinovorans]|nr:alpha integrin [Paenarthrobacter nicotinovorans]
MGSGRGSAEGRRLFLNSEFGAGLFGNTHIGVGWGYFDTLI